MGKQMALSWGLLGFGATVARGLFSSANLDSTLRAAMLSLVVFYGLGWFGAVLWNHAFDSTTR